MFFIFVKHYILQFLRLMIRTNIRIL